MTGRRKSGVVINIGDRTGSPKIQRPPKVDEKLEVVSRTEVVERLKSLGNGWGDLVERKLGLPKGNLYRGKTENSEFYLDVKDSSKIIEVLQWVLVGGETPASWPGYAIALHETANSVYVILIDGRKGIVVREMVSSIQNSGMQGWLEVGAAIDAAVTETLKEQNRGRIVVNNGGITVV
ncbi:hypothetical protein HYT84_04035 [Candidatus Micrarchaeota archaeon]|nr:hypothetical protein [Candidatus Micrarchaeota archaeon]